MTTKKRVIWLDIVRIIAFLMVIIMHSPLNTEGVSSSNLMWLTSYITAPCIGLFFMVSGALLIPTNERWGSFLKKRFIRIASPTIFWSCVYILVALLLGEKNIADTIKSVFLIPFCPQGHGIMWFMYTLIGLYMIIPLISPWIIQATKRELQILLLLWGVAFCIPYFQEILPLQQGAYNPLFYFGGFFGYMLAGHYLTKYPVKVNCKRTIIFSLLIICVSFVPLLIMKKYGINYHEFKEDPFWYLSISVAIMCVGWFILIQKSIQKIRISERTKSIIIDLSNLSFGIYFIHILIMRKLLWNIEFVNTLPIAIEIPVCALLTFIISYLIIKAISYSRFSKYIIGA